MECGVWSVECGVWSHSTLHTPLECGVRQCTGGCRDERRRSLNRRKEAGAGRVTCHEGRSLRRPVKHWQWSPGQLIQIDRLA